MKLLILTMVALLCTPIHSEVATVEDTTTESMVTIKTTRVKTISPIYREGLTISLQHVQGIGGNFQGEPQGMAYDAVNDVFYGMGNDSGARQVKKINSSGTTVATNNNQGGSSKNIQDGAVYNGKVYVPRGTGLHTVPSGQTGYVQVFDLDLVFEQEITLPMSRYATAIAFKHGYWWASCYDHQIYQLSADLSSVIAIHDVSGGNKPSTIKSYGGMDWLGNYLLGTEHDATEMDVWYWNGSTLSLVQELSTAGLDLDNGIAVDETNSILYGSSRDLADDIQEYNIIIN